MMMMKYPVMEIFDSIQGEGLMVGRPCTFIRLAGCNLNCEWCDTPEISATEMTPYEIADRINNLLVVITGGEPTIHPLEDLVSALYGSKIAIETNGTNPVPKGIGWITCSPKPANNYKIHPKLKPKELKYVCCEDFRVGVIPNKYKAKMSIWIQPLSSTDREKSQRSIKKALEIVARHQYLSVGPRLHKTLGVR